MRPLTSHTEELSLSLVSILRRSLWHIDSVIITANGPKLWRRVLATSYENFQQAGSDSVWVGSRLLGAKAF